jgi:hypothetical protein
MLRVRLIKQIVILALIGVLLLFSCSKKETTEPPDDSEIGLQEINDVLPNPFKGFAPWVGGGNPVYQTKLQYVTFPWKELEPSRGVFDWAKLERYWGNVTVNERRVGFRIAAAVPGAIGHIDIPQWLVDMGVRMRAYEIDNAYGLAPDWDDPNFLQAHHELVLALGARYDSDPRVAWIDIGSYGFWGEWHVYLNDSLAATQASKQSILEDYFTAFPTKRKVIAFDDDFATKYVNDHGGGIRNDCLGTQESNDWYLESLHGIDPTLNERVWKTAIITGEFCGSDEGAVQGTTLRFDLNYQFIKQTHWSFIGPAGGAILPQDEQHRANLDKLVKTLGYRFVLKQVTHSKTISTGEILPMTIQVENKGVAPFYFQWPLVAYLVTPDSSVAAQQDLAVDIRQWLPGTTSFEAGFSIPVDIQSGSYEIKLSINDPLTNLPGVWFANTRRDSMGRYLVSQILVE